MDEPRTGHWHRRHVNGMFATVSVMSADDNRYTYSAHPDGVFAPGGDTTGLENAEAKADAMANCPHCSCPPWTE